MKKIPQISYYHDIPEEIDSPKDLEMKEKGFDHITNFSPDEENIYRKAAKIHRLRYSIQDDAYDIYGYKLIGLKAFYVHNKSIIELPAFWNTFDKLEREEAYEYGLFTKRITGNHRR